MTTTLPKIHLDEDALPDELMLVSIAAPDTPSWLVQRLRAHVVTTCNVCQELIGSHDRVYYEVGFDHPSHAVCWITQLTARPVRVLSVRYRGR